MSVAKRIIPCLDVDKGRVVKGVNFVNIKDAGDPVEIAKRYDDQGADELTMLDITASSETREITYKTVESIAGQVFIPLTVGGGVRNTQDIKRLLRSGADKVSINTAAVENPDFIKEASDKFGSVHSSCGRCKVHRRYVYLLGSGDLRRKKKNWNRCN